KTTKELVRIYLTGDCDGLPDLREAFAAHPEVELVGSAAQVSEAAPTLTGGHLQVVLHATRAATLPVNELAAIREHTRAPVVLLAKTWGRRAPRLAPDLQFGDAAIMLGIEREKTIYDLVTAPGELDSEKLAGYTTRHSSGLDVLPAPLRPEDAELVTEAKLARLLEVARESYDVIVVDTSPFFHGPMLATFDRTDEPLLTCGLDVPPLQNVRPSLPTRERL